MATILDKEFGVITVRRSPRASQVRIKVAPDGQLRVSMPMYAPLFLVKRLINTSRANLRTMLSDHEPLTLNDGMQIGKSHTLVIFPGRSLSASRSGQQIILYLPSSAELNDSHVIQIIKPVILKALRLEAKSYLPKRLMYLAAHHGYSYQKVRFSHASGRWGSCSSNGTISLNIALMKLPFELIDYVLLHELAHTKEMNHSSSFWHLVEASDPLFKHHRKLLKQESPSI